MALLDKFFQVGKRRSLHSQVVDHLTRLLNTRTHFGAWQRDFGLGDYSGNFSCRQLCDKAAAEIAKTIRKYDTRVQLDRIEPIASSSDLNLRFRIYCTIAGLPQKLSVAFENKKNQITVEIIDE